MPRDAIKLRLLLVGLLLSLAAIVGVELLPDRTLDLTRPGAVGNLFLITPGDVRNDPPVQWVDARRLHWRCRYAPTDHDFPCGLTLILSGKDPARGLDLTRFHSLELDLAYHGSSPQVRVAIRNFDPRFSKLEDGNSARIQAINLRARDVEHPVVLDLSEFTVPEWWVSQYNLPREYNRPRLDNATSLSVDLPANLAGQEHDLELRRLVLRGEWLDRSLVYFAILSAWMLGAAFLVMRRWAELRRRYLRQQREIDALTARTRALRVEQDNLRRLATVDELTGVLNRRGLEAALDDFEARAEGVTLVLLDIDHFKRVNDRWGHAAGDEVLRRVAAIAAANLRASDVIGRWGGEEFLVACRGHHIDDAARLAEKLRASVENGNVDAKSRFSITASFGVALAPTGTSTLRAFKRADAALYRAKSGGRNRVEVDTTHDAATTL
ncbi:MAG: GGDEF domain-containing protein [Burkholderiales bacterium]|nr:GGDEF domain-containing protein [Burkholderiales bacterium]